MNMTIDWTVVDEMAGYSQDPPTNYEDLIKLDQRTREAGFGDQWMVSKRRAQILKDIRGRTVTMAELDDKYVRIPTSVMHKAMHEANGKTLPLVIYRDGERIEAGTAILTADKVGMIAEVRIDGEYALDILKDGTPAFSIGVPSTEVEIINKEFSRLPKQTVRTARRERRLLRRRKK